MSDTRTEHSSSTLSNEQKLQELIEDLGDWLRDSCRNVQEVGSTSSGGAVFGFTYDGVSVSLSVNVTP
jgi:hypothetical protein